MQWFIRIAYFVYFQNHLDWPVERWANVIVSDEKVFQVGHNGQVRVRRPVGQRFNPAYMVASNTSGRFTVPVWGCMSGTAGMALSRINRHLYRE